MLSLPVLISYGGPVFWLILIAGAVALAVFIERVLYCHRAQINSLEFLNGVKTVLRRENVVEALSICDATPGPVARLVKDRNTEPRQWAGAGSRSVGGNEPGGGPPARGETEPDRHYRPNLPLLGLLGTVLGLIQIFMKMQEAGLHAHVGLLATGVWQALVCGAAGLAVAIPAHAGYNYLVSRVNSIVLDMERAATEIVNVVSDDSVAKQA